MPRLPRVSVRLLPSDDVDVIVEALIESRPPLLYWTPSFQIVTPSEELVSQM